MPHSVYSTMPVPVYELPPYMFSGLSFADLPQRAREFLSSPSLATPELVHDQEIVNSKLTYLSHKLMRSCTGVHVSLVHLRREVASLAADASKRLKDAAVPGWALVHAQPEPELSEKRVQIAGEVLTLLPEWRAHLDEFMEDLDALVWFDVHARLGTPDEVTPEVELLYRESRAQPILRATIEALLALDAAAVKADIPVTPLPSPPSSPLPCNLLTLLKEGRKKKRASLGPGAITGTEDVKEKENILREHQIGDGYNTLPRMRPRGNQPFGLAKAGANRPSLCGLARDI